MRKTIKNEEYLALIKLRNNMGNISFLEAESDPYYYDEWFGTQEPAEFIRDVLMDDIEDIEAWLKEKGIQKPAEAVVGDIVRNLDDQEQSLLVLDEMALSNAYGFDVMFDRYWHDPHQELKQIRGHSPMKANPNITTFERFVADIKRQAHNQGHDQSDIDRVFRKAGIGPSGGFEYEQSRLEKTLADMKADFRIFPLEGLDEDSRRQAYLNAYTHSAKLRHTLKMDCDDEEPLVLQWNTEDFERHFANAFNWFNECMAEELLEERTIGLSAFETMDLWGEDFTDKDRAFFEDYFINNPNTPVYSNVDVQNNHSIRQAVAEHATIAYLGNDWRDPKVLAFYEEPVHEYKNYNIYLAYEAFNEAMGNPFPELQNVNEYHYKEFHSKRKFNNNINDIVSRPKP